ncbi:Flp pilus assembly protein CpaB [Caldovatus aquaticus]|uniref:Flp pilus assembly protein CpaB n=1 Tax=Caldovatus aquaticus TaxID=2865671 RepID=A0ABS7F697_9PROT|nr:Flp pilus assembly protein CpaB [Caldovatus aquaticus]MBW8271137.1 Flp pilus assembly protein CpaB [Caldovatus aquaticus]
MALRLILVALLGLAAVGVGLIATAAFPPAPAERPDPAAEAVPAPRQALLVAARPVPAGTLLKPEDVAARELPGEEAPADGFRDTPGARAEVLGAMVRRSLLPGEPLRAAGLLRAGESGFLAAVLAPGMRAVTVGVDQVTGAAGLIWPGDRVDVILVQHLADPALPLARRHVGELVLAGARVIAVDRHLVQGVQPGGPDVVRDTLRTVTLEVTPEQATRVALASGMGRLSLALRAAGAPPAEAAAAFPPPAAPEPPQPPHPVWGGDVSAALVRDPALPRPPGSVVRIIQGGEGAQEIRFR